MLPEKDRVRILDMLDHAGEVLGFAEGKSRSDLDILWDIVSEDIPRLASDLESIVRNR